MPFGYVYHISFIMREHYEGEDISYLREASALLVLTVRAMRRPPKQNKQQSNIPTHFSFILPLSGIESADNLNAN